MVVGRHSGWSDDGAQIVTRTQIRVVSYLKGHGPPELTVLAEDVCQEVFATPLPRSTASCRSRCGPSR